MPQRCHSHTRCANPDYDPKLATFDDFYADTLQVIDYVTRRLGQEKVVALGQSWGSVLGLHLARRNPELLHAYVGTAQVINTWQGEVEGYRFALDEARRRDDKEAIEALESIAPYPTIDGLDAKLGVQRYYVQKYGGSLRNLDFFELFETQFFESPFYSVCDWMGFVNTNFSPEYPHRGLVKEQLAQDSEFGNFDRYPTDYEVPVFFFLGAHDWHTPTTLAVSYFERINAPHKKLVLFEESAHAATYREKDKFAKALVDYVLPVAK